MRRDALVDYVADALRAGHSRDSIQSDLKAAGWTQDRIEAGLGSWSDGSGGLPVPRPTPNVSPAEFALYTLLYGALAFSAVHLVGLMHELIDLMTEGSEVVGYDLRWSVASLIVSVPLFAVLLRRDRRNLAKEPGTRRSIVRNWISHIAVVVTAIVLLGVLVSVIFRLLSGDLTGAYVAKALAVAVVGAGALWFSVKETR